MKKTKHIKIILIVLLLLIAVLAAAVLYVNSKLDMIQFDDGSRPIDTNAMYDPAENIVPEDLPEREEQSIYVDQKENGNENVINILLLGTDERTERFSDNARADSIMVLSLNMRVHTIKLVSIERGIGVEVPGRNDDWLTHTFRYGGAKLTMDTVRKYFNLDLDRYVRVNFNIFEEAINTIGGVDVCMTPEEAAGLSTWHSNAFCRNPVQPGWNHLDGYDALQYCRLRSIDSDWRRIERQRAVIQAAIDKVRELDLQKLNQLANTLLPMVKTNLTKEDMAKLLLELPGFISTGAQAEQMTIPSQDTCWSRVGVDGRRLIAVDFEKNAEILHEFFYSEE